MVGYQPAFLWEGIHSSKQNKQTQYDTWWLIYASNLTFHYFAGHHHRDQQSRDHVRVRFANEHELNDNHPKGIALYHRGFKLNGYTQHSGRVNSAFL